MTLIETLAVVVILGIAATMSIGMVGPMSAAAQRREVVATATEFFERARLLAQRTGGAAVTAGETLTARPQGNPGMNADADELTIDRALPAGWSCALRQAPDSQRIEVFAISARGDSIDCVIELSNRRGDNIRIRRLGVSGQIRTQAITGGDSR
ncbi:MAG: type II secretion system protein [Phycisphaeraceae bacterium]|nr:type II secretion system protein [Phycisphaeraceae bacterium]